jgi:zinc D-Ala-D-Ala dipeptidase
MSSHWLVIAAALSASRVEPLVEVKPLIPDAVIDLKYATPDNFLKKKVYPDSAKCLLRESVARRLVQAARELRAAGYRLKLFDCYRPLRVQWEMWKILPQPGYVADPRTGGNHNRGAAVDLTIVTRDGLELEMPTPFDTFTEQAHHGYPGGTEASRRHRELLLKAMESAGFRKNRMEWWHYDAPNPKRFSALDQPFEAFE